jgi:hypothetical protein
MFVCKIHKIKLVNAFFLICINFITKCFLFWVGSRRDAMFAKAIFKDGKAQKIGAWLVSL